MDGATPNRQTAVHAFKTSVPVLLGYVAIGIGFGLLAVNSGYPAWFALAMSVFIYAGAAQYIGISLFAAGASLAEIALVTLIVNLRHAAYGLSLISSYRKYPRFRPYLIFALTDETYALLSSASESDRNNGTFMLMVSAFNQVYWVVGTAIGALAGSFIPYKIDGLNFALTAMFLVLAVEQVLRVRKAMPFLLAGIATIVARLIAGSRGTIVVGLCLAIGMLAIGRHKKEKNHAQS